jgi:hypothetical protein
VKPESNAFSETWQAFRNTLRAAYGLAPAVVIVGLILSLIIIVISLYFVEIMVGVIILLIVIISIMVYVASNNYGDAALALIAGLLAAFTVDWTWNRFVVFFFALIGFLSFILLTVSIKLAARNEDLYLRAAIYIDEIRPKEIEKQLRKLSEETRTKKLGPIEKADAIQIMAFRKIPIESMKYMLESVDIISGITNLDAKSATLFLFDISRAMNIIPGPDYKIQIDNIFNIYRDAPVSHEEFIQAFMNSRRLVISGKMPPYKYLILLKLGLTKGVSPTEMLDFIKENELTSNRQNVAALEHEASLH